MGTMYLSLLPLIVLVLALCHADTYAMANLQSSTRTGRAVNHIIKTTYSESYNAKNNMDISVTGEDLDDSVSFANRTINMLHRLETSLGWSEINVKSGTPSQGMLISFGPEEEAVKRGKEALVALKASTQLLNVFCSRHYLNQHDCVKYLTNFKFDNTALKSSCVDKKNYCSREEYLYPYRSINGSCNHISNGIQGESFTGYTRLLYPDYLDAINIPRRAFNKRPMPSPRAVSTTIVNHDDDVHSSLTLAVMQWGQFIEHDLSRTALSTMVHYQNAIECCSGYGRNLSPRYIHPFCSPVSVPRDDAYYSNMGVNCMNYVRSMPAIRSDCSFGPTNQLNQATHYLDGSQIYGSTYKRSHSLRAFTNGKLEVSSSDGKNYLPISQDPAKDCQVLYIEKSCFKSGDMRVNFQPQLTAMHTLWYREHNRIAEALAKRNSNWDDETLFQETRRIVIAEMQRITYREWLKKVLSSKYKSLSEISSSYGENVNPTISNSFSSAAMRSLKSLYDGNIKLYDEDRSSNRSLSLQNYFNNASVLHKPGIFDALVRGLATQKSHKLGRHYAEDLINRLYTNGQFGFDALGMDIQRGRDHGLPGYTQFRVLCGLQNANSFQDFADSISEKHIQLLSKAYTHPKDVDLIVGGLLEEHEESSIFGPTFSCIFADQFARTKQGDRYFYTNENQPRPFTTSQLAEIEKVTLARIFCDNGDDIQMMQPNVFENISESNKLVSCDGDDIPRLDFSPWDESRARYFSN